MSNKPEIPRLKRLPEMLCAQGDPDAWFPNRDGDSLPTDLDGLPLDEVKEMGRAITAKSVCMRCAGRLECLEEALERKEPHGIWGGLTTKERGKLMKQRRLV